MGKALSIFHSDGGRGDFAHLFPFFLFLLSSLIFLFLGKAFQGRRERRKTDFRFGFDLS